MRKWHYIKFLKKNHLDTVHQTRELEAIILEALPDRKRKTKDRWWTNAVRSKEGVYTGNKDVSFTRYYQNSNWSLRGVQLWYPSISTLKAIIKRTKAMKTGLTTRLVDMIRNAIRRRFSNAFWIKRCHYRCCYFTQLYLIKWVKSQERKGYIQTDASCRNVHPKWKWMLGIHSYAQRKDKKRDFQHDFDTEVEKDIGNNVKSEPTDFLRNLRSLECL